MHRGSPKRADRRLSGLLAHHGSDRGLVQPGPIDRAIVRRRLAVRQRAPRLDGILRLAKIFHERVFGMVPAPAPAFIQIGEIVEPLLGDDAPSVQDVLSVLAEVLGIVSLGHEKVRKEVNGRRRNERIMRCLPDILWKTSAKSSASWRKCDALHNRSRK